MLLTDNVPTDNLYTHHSQNQTNYETKFHNLTEELTSEEDLAKAKSLAQESVRALTSRFPSMVHGESSAIVRVPTALVTTLPRYFLNRETKKARTKKAHLNGNVHDAQLHFAVSVTVRKHKYTGELVVFYCLIDGNGRTANYLAGRLNLPEELTVTVYVDITTLGAAATYVTFDSNESAKTKGQQTVAVRKAIDFKPQSKLVQGAWTTAISAVATKAGFLDAMQEVLPALRKIDELGLDTKSRVTGANDSRKYNAGMKTAFLESVHKALGDEEALNSVIAFWVAYNANYDNDDHVFFKATRDELDSLKAEKGANGVNSLRAFIPTEIERFNAE